MNKKAALITLGIFLTMFLFVVGLVIKPIITVGLLLLGLLLCLIYCIYQIVCLELTR